MKVLVATDGKLDPELAARYAKPLAGPNGSIDIVSVIEIPRRLLAEIRSHYGAMEGQIVDRDAEYVPGALAQDTPPSFNWPGEDAFIQRYLSDKKDEYTSPIVSQLATMGAEATGEVVEGENAGSTILRLLEERDIDVVLIGSHGQGVFDGLLGSTGTKITRQAKCSVMVLRG